MTILRPNEVTSADRPGCGFKFRAADAGKAFGWFLVASGPARPHSSLAICLMTSEYPFEDFRRHLQDVMHRRFIRDVEDPEGSFEANVSKVRDYLSEFYDKDELPQKVLLFVEIYRHICFHAADYDVGLLGICDDDGIHASDALQYAVHWYFTSRPPAEWNRPGTIEMIKQKASEWKPHEAAKATPV